MKRNFLFFAALLFIAGCTTQNNPDEPKSEIDYSVRGQLYTRTPLYPNDDGIGMAIFFDEFIPYSPGPLDGYAIYEVNQDCALCKAMRDTLKYEQVGQNITIHFPDSDAHLISYGDTIVQMVYLPEHEVRSVLKPAGVYPLKLHKNVR